MYSYTFNEDYSEELDRIEDRLARSTAAQGPCTIDLGKATWKVTNRREIEVRELLASFSLLLGGTILVLSAILIREEVYHQENKLSDDLKLRSDIFLSSFCLGLIVGVFQLIFYSCISRWRIWAIAHFTAPVILMVTFILVLISSFTDNDQTYHGYKRDHFELGYFGYGFLGIILMDIVYCFCAATYVISQQQI